MGDDVATTVPIRCISSMATRQILAEVAQAFELRGSCAVDVRSVGGVDALRRVQDGEPFDVVVLARDAIDKLADAGRVDAASRADVARSGVAIAVAAGAPRPSVESESAVRDALLRARSIGYSTGPSGVHLMRLFERWGIADTIASRVVQAKPGVPVASLVARGDVDLGFQQLSELVSQPGIDVIGMLPPSIQVVTVFSAAVCTASASPANASDFVRFIASAETDDVKRRHGMEPARAGA